MELRGELYWAKNGFWLIGKDVTGRRVIYRLGDAANSTLNTFQRMIPCAPKETATLKAARETVHKFAGD